MLDSLERQVTSLISFVPVLCAHILSVLLIVVLQMKFTYTDINVGNTDIFSRLTRQVENIIQIVSENVGAYTWKQKLFSMSQGPTLIKHLPYDSITAWWQNSILTFLAPSCCQIMTFFTPSCNMSHATAARSQWPWVTSQWACLHVWSCPVSQIRDEGKGSRREQNVILWV